MFSSTHKYVHSLQSNWAKSCYLQCLHCEFKHSVRSSQPYYDWWWSEILKVITCTYKVNVTVEDITSDLSTFKTADEVSVISDATNYLLNAFHLFSSPVNTFHRDNRVRADALNSAAFKIFIDTISTVFDVNNQILNTSHMSAFTSLTVFVKSMPACIKKRLIPSLIFL